MILLLIVEDRESMCEIQCNAFFQLMTPPPLS